jgi:cytochrome c oxidase subunit 1
MLIAVPTGVKFFNWIGTMWGGKVVMATPMLWACGFIVTFLFGGLTGVILAMPALNFHVSDTYFVVAHFHYTVFGTVVFAMFAGYYFWWPKLTGRRLDERLGKIHFWMLFIGFHTTFLIQHILGIWGMPRRYADYLVEDDFQLLNQVSTVGAALLALSTLVFIWNVFTTWQTAPLVESNDPWGYGASLEWATSCPPPRHNFYQIPIIRSERPAFDLHHPAAAPHQARSDLEKYRERAATDLTSPRAPDSHHPASRATHAAQDSISGRQEQVADRLNVNEEESNHGTHTGQHADHRNPTGGS